MTERSVVVVVGTRPEAIKMAPVYLALQADPGTEVRVLATAQHRELMDQVLSAFDIEATLDLDLMRTDQPLGNLTSRAILAVQEVLADWKPDVVLVHGDTTTCLAAALAAFYERIRVGHVEAGLRTYDLEAPWPEEMNRRLVDPISRWCFAPTESAAENLRSERIPEQRVFVTGNTVIDALLLARARVHREVPEVPGLSAAAFACQRIILITGHRRESFGAPLEEFCLALRDIAREFEDTALVYPVHLNPQVQEPVRRILESEERVFLIPPLPYLSFVHLMDCSTLIITDSGGIQEEAPSLGKPVLVTREATERPEAVEAGVARLVGTNRQTIVEETRRLLNDPAAYAQMARAENPYGDGKASQRIATILHDELTALPRELGTKSVDD
jgi:UDP-N-acetylglucosamine 2-epimerase (non-hydrolysing)